MKKSGKKEEASRLQEEAVNYAKKVYEENERLRKTLKRVKVYC